MGKPTVGAFALVLLGLTNLGCRHQTYKDASGRAPLGPQGEYSEFVPNSGEMSLGRPSSPFTPASPGTLPPEIGSLLGRTASVGTPTSTQVPCGLNYCTATVALVDGTLVRGVGSSNIYGGALAGPADLTVLPDSKVVVTNSHHQQVDIFNPDLSHLASIGHPGSAPDEFNDTYSITTSKDGHFFVLDINTSLKEFSPSGQFLYQHNWGPASPGSETYNCSPPPLGCVLRFQLQTKIYIDRGDPQNHFMYLLGYARSTPVSNVYKTRVIRYRLAANGPRYDLVDPRVVDLDLFSPKGIAIWHSPSNPAVTAFYVAYTDSSTYLTRVARYASLFEGGVVYQGNFQPGGYAGYLETDNALNRLYVADLWNNTVKAFSPLTGALVFNLGSTGTGPGQFKGAQAVSVNPTTHDIYVLDNGNGRFQRFNMYGAYLGSGGHPPVAEPGKFNRIANVQVDPVTAEIYALDIYNGRVQVLDGSGNFLREMGGLIAPQWANVGVPYTGPYFSYPGEIQAHWPSRRIYVADSFNQRIAVYGTTGGFIKSFGRPSTIPPTADRDPLSMNNPLYLHLKDNYLFVAEWGDSFGDPQSLGPNMKGRVQAFDLEGNFKFTIARFATLAASGNPVPGTIYQPIGVYTDPRPGVNRIYVGDRNITSVFDYSNCIGAAISCNAVYVQQLPFSGTGEIDLAGNLYLSANEQVSIYNVNNLSQAPVILGAGHGVDLGQLIYPWRPALGPNSEIYVGGWNDRVTIFYKPGRYEPRLLRASQFAGQSIGAPIQASTGQYVMMTGVPYNVSFSFANLGAMTWSESQSFRLGAVGSTPWSPSRAYMSGSTGYQQTATFNFQVTPPSTPNTYPLSFGMLQEMVTWFGPTNTPTPQVKVVTPVNTGYLDGIYQESGGTYLRGWACAVGYQSPIAVHVYVGGPAGVGTHAISGVADQPSDAAIAAYCLVGNNHRFSIRLDDPANNVLTRFPGRSVYVHGINPFGQANTTIGNSGGIVLPGARDTLAAGQALLVGQTLVSRNGIYTLIFQGDGNLVIYNNLWQPRWATYRSSARPNGVYMQGDGNFVVYDASWVPLWYTGTVVAGSSAVMRDDGRLVIVSPAGVVLWSTP